MLKEQLVYWTVNYAKEFYQLQYNPLGIIDNTISQIQQAEFTKFYLLETFYAKLASVYRYKHGETQLEFLFDGASHYEKYKTDWLDNYQQWVRELFSERLTLRAILEITVFNQHSDHQLQLINLRLQSYIEHYFAVRLYTHRGIVDRQSVA